ncbi:hypothetical protein OAJ50_03980 [Candidatus Nitrosopelagicus sp.]|nr:hypothetical protein [Candidatus Nitrosopelagicus sp.]
MTRRKGQSLTECWAEEQACKECYVNILERWNWSPLARSYWNYQYRPDFNGDEW